MVSPPQPGSELVIIDGTALLFRAYYGARPSEAPDGTPVGAVLGTARTLVEVMGRARTTHVVVVFDAGQRTFRNDIDAAYKANRGAPPPDLVPQFSLVQAMIGALGFRTLCTPGFEADDLMATLARRARREGWGSWLISPDKDLFQLVEEAAPRIRVFQWHTRTVVDRSGVIERLGVPPERAIDYFALVGDSSDNVQGVRGVGPKAAAAVVSALGDLDAIYGDLDAVATVDVRGAKTLGAKLEAGREDAALARRLVALRDDVPLDIEGPVGPWSSWRGPHAEAAEVFSRLGEDGPLRAMRGIAQRRQGG